jgi:hypothetical protein
MAVVEVAAVVVMKAAAAAVAVQVAQVVLVLDSLGHQLQELLEAELQIHIQVQA